MRYTISLLITLFFISSCQPVEEQQQVVETNPTMGEAPVVTPEPAPITPPRQDPPEATEPKGFLKIGVLGDLNGSLGDPTYANTVKTGMEAIIKSDFDIIIGTGDFTSGEDYNYRFAPSRFTEMWASFEQKILNPILNTGIPFAPSPGNHDASIERERGYYQTFWGPRLPGVTMISSEAYPFYYSFLYKGVFFISMDNVRTGTIRESKVNGVTQRDWIISQLNTPQAREAVARIAFGHVPIYPVLSKSKHLTSRDKKYNAILYNEQQGKRSNALEDIFKNGDLNLTVFGHSHAYYPGVVHHNDEPLEDSLNVLSMPCMGYGNRYLDQRTSARSARGYGSISVNLESGQIVLDAYTATGIKVQKSTLPEKIKPYSHLSIRRHDIVQAELGNL